jgi:hypothetical protein
MQDVSRQVSAQYSFRNAIKNNEHQSALIREVSRPGLRMEQKKMCYTFETYTHYLIFTNALTCLLPFVE